MAQYDYDFSKPETEADFDFSKPPTATEQVAPTLWGQLWRAGTQPFINVATGLVNLPGEAYRAISSDIRLAGELAQDPSRIPSVAAETGRRWGRGIIEAAPTLASTIMGSIAAGPVGMATVPAGERYLRSLLEGKPVEQAYEEAATLGIAGALPAVPGAIGRTLRPAVSAAGKRLVETGKRAGFTPLASDVLEPGTRGLPALRSMQGLAQKQVGGGALTARDIAERQAMFGKAGTADIGYVGRTAEQLAGPVPASVETAGQSVQSRLAGLEVRRQQRFETVKDRFLERSGAQPVAEGIRGEQVSEGLRNIYAGNRLQDDLLWNTARQASTGQPVFPLNQVAERAAEIIRQGRLVENVLQSGETGARLRPTMGTMTTEGAFVGTGAVAEPAESFFVRLANLRGKRVSFEEADAIRRAIGDRIASDPTAKHVYRGIMEDFDAWATTLPESEAVGALTAAREWHKANVVPFQEGQVLGNLVRTGAEPVRVVDALLSPRDTGIERLRAFRTQTQGQGQAWDSLRGATIQRAMESPKAFDRLGPITRGMLLTEQEQAFIARYHQLSAAEKPVVREFMGASASQVPLKIWDLGERGISKIETLKRAVGEQSQAWKDVQSDLLHRLVKDPSVMLGGGDPSRLPVPRMSSSWARTVFTPEQAEFLAEVQNYLRTSRAMERITATTKVAATGQHGVVGVQYTALGAAIWRFAVGDVAGGATAMGVVVSPTIIAKLASSPRTNRLLIEAMRERPNTIRGMQISALLQQAIRETQQRTGVSHDPSRQRHPTQRQIPLLAIHRRHPGRRAVRHVDGVGQLHGGTGYPA